MSGLLECMVAIGKFGYSSFGTGKQNRRPMEGRLDPIWCRIRTRKERKK